MKKQLLFLFSFILVIALFQVVSAETLTQSLQTDFIKTCTNSSGSICSSSAVCEVSIKFPRNNSYVVNNVSMTNNNDGQFNYTLSANNLAVLGTYNWDMFCCDGTDCGEAHGDFLVTKTGVELNQEKATVYLGMLGLLILLFIASCVTMPFLPSGNNKDEEFFISINNLKYLKPVIFAFAWGIGLAILFVASNISFLYLETEMMGKLLFAFYTIMMWMTLPVAIILFLFILVNIFRDREMKELIERGVQIPSTM